MQGLTADAAQRADRGQPRRRSTLTKLTTAQVAGLNTTAVGNLTDHPGRRADLDPGRHRWRTAQIGALTSTEIQAFTTTQANALTATQLGGLTTTALDNLSTTQLRALTTTQVQGLTTTQLNALPTANLDAVDLDQAHRPRRSPG